MDVRGVRVSFPEAIDPRRVRVAMPSLSGVRLPRLHKPSRLQVLIAAIVLLVVCASTWLLVRNSSLVAVEEVDIVGLEGFYDRAAREAVTAEAMQMTTMNFDAARIREAAEAFVSIEGVRIVTDLPHSVRIHLDVVRPVVAGKVNGRTVALSKDGEILAGAAGLSMLPSIDVTGVIRGNRVTDGKALGAATVLGAAPDVLLRKVAEVRWGRNGLTLELEKGVLLYFGNSKNARTKWRDATSVLAAPGTAGLSYIDLRAPGRPAVGGLGAAPVTIVPGAAEALPDATASDPGADATATPGATSQTGVQAPTAAPTETPAQAPVQQTAPAPVGGASPSP